MFLVYNSVYADASACLLYKITPIHQSVQDIFDQPPLSFDELGLFYKKLECASLEHVDFVIERTFGYGLICYSTHFLCQSEYVPMDSAQ